MPTARCYCGAVLMFIDIIVIDRFTFVFPVWPYPTIPRLSIYVKNMITDATTDMVTDMLTDMITDTTTDATTDIIYSSHDNGYIYMITDMMASN